MTTFEEGRLGFHTALVALTSFVRADRVLASQIPSGRRLFFGADDASGAGAAAAQRFLEWFALERRAEGSGGPPIVAFQGAGCPGLEPRVRPYAAALAASRVGVFAVRDADDGGLEVEDAVTGRVHRVWLPATERRARVGTSLVGRLAKVPEDDAWIATDSTEVFPGTRLFDAYAEEAERARLETGRVPELSQLELEPVLRAQAEGADEEPRAVEAALGRFLGEAVGSGRLPSVDDLSYALSATSRPGPVIGPFLDRIAFDTGLDLETAQKLCLRLWNAHQRVAGQDAAGKAGAPAAATSPPRPEELGREVLAELEAGIARGDDLEGLFDRLEDMAGAGAEPLAGDGEETGSEVEDEGDLDALLTEYLWERERTGRPIAGKDAVRLRAVARALADRGQRAVEHIERPHLAAAIVQDWAAGREDECLATAAAITGWADWLEAVQDLELRFDAAGFLVELREARRRVATLMPRITARATGDGEVRPWRVLARAGAEGGGWRLASRTGELFLPAALPFRSGDLVLGCPTGPEGFRPGCRVVPSCLAEALD